ncbi:unnamed protein product [Heligmosomoides polygyrus]|uniref:Tudor domain-containing protein n=1 Tax=Heligmosomoides polygyrus TaxID=6339 RepID=A0A183FPD8_HELPZ|nr:unnamed protein product [Heligmosomoides polygyrus]
MNARLMDNIEKRAWSQRQFGNQMSSYTTAGTWPGMKAGDVLAKPKEGRAKMCFQTEEATWVRNHAVVFDYDSIHNQSD